MKLKLRLPIILATTTVVSAAAAGGADYRVSAVDFSVENDSMYLVIKGDSRPSFSCRQIEDPFRVAVDIRSGVVSGLRLEPGYLPPLVRVSAEQNYSSGPLLTIVAEFDRRVKYNAYASANDIVLAVPLPTVSKASADDVQAPVPGWLTKKVSIAVEASDLASTLRLLAMQNGFDMVLPDLRDVMVSAHLSDVTLKEALDAILEVSGYSYFTVGDVVVVKRFSEEAPGELVTKVFSLKFIDAKWIEPQIKNMLSSRGKVQVVSAAEGSSKRTSSEQLPARIISVTDVPAVIPAISDFISKVDIRPAQIAIEVKLIETNLSEDQSFGLNWQKSFTGKITGAEEGIQADATGQAEPLSVISSLPIKAGSFSYGTLTVSEVSLLLQFLKSTGKSRLLSNPTVTTSDGRPAKIDVATTIPIQTVNRFSEGAVIQDIVTFEYKDVGISLEVVPRVNDNGYVTLSCRPVVEEIVGWVGPADNQQPITSKRSVTTEVVVKGGETLVIGGLLKENVIENVEGVWLLSDIPYLGNLFKHRTKKSTKTELTILITPTMLP